MGRAQAFPKRSTKFSNITISPKEIRELTTPRNTGVDHSEDHKEWGKKSSSTDGYVGQPEYETKHDEKFYMNHLSRRARKLLHDISALPIVGSPTNPTPVYPTEQ